MPQHLTNEKSTLDQVKVLCHQATSHNLNQCWPRSVLPYGVTRPSWHEWVKEHFSNRLTFLLDFYSILFYGILLMIKSDFLMASAIWSQILLNYLTHTTLALCKRQIGFIACCTDQRHSIQHIQSIFFLVAVPSVSVEQWQVHSACIIWTKHHPVHIHRHTQQ